MKLPIALAVLTAVASTYASPMPEGQGQVQTTSVAPMTSDEFVLRFQPFCEKLLFGGDGTLDKIKSKFEELYRKIDDYEDEEQMLRVMCAHIISITPTVASSQLGSGDSNSFGDGVDPFMNRSFGPNVNPAAEQDGSARDYQYDSPNPHLTAQDDSGFSGDGVDSFYGGRNPYLHDAIYSTDSRSSLQSTP